MATTIAAYPLTWPAGWKRTAAHYRLRAKFNKARQSGGNSYTPSRQLSVADGLERVMDELGRMGLGRDDVVVSTNLRTRLDGLPRSDQAEPADPGAAVYWEDKKGGHKVMAIDIYDRVADNLAAIAATLEAMRAIERHGGAAVLERAFTGFIALPAPIVAGMHRPWREVFDYGFEKVDLKLIERRYRSLANEHHPDKPNGSHAKMAELNAARDEALKEIQS